MLIIYLLKQISGHFWPMLLCLPLMVLLAMDFRWRVKNKKLSNKRIQVSIILFLTPFIITILLPKVCYTKDFKRHSTSELDSQLIEKAENLEVENLFAKSVDNIMVARQVNKKSLAYYEDLLDKLQRDLLFTGFTYMRVHMSYNAWTEVIKIDESDEHRLYRVFLELNFSTYVGPMCAVAVVVETEIVFDKDYNVIQIRNKHYTPIS